MERAKKIRNSIIAGIFVLGSLGVAVQQPDRPIKRAPLYDYSVSNEEYIEQSILNGTIPDLLYTKGNNRKEWVQSHQVIYREYDLREAVFRSEISAYKELRKRMKQRGLDVKDIQYD